MSRPVTVLTMPFGEKMNAHSLAVTAVGIAHGTRTAARSSARPQMLRPMITAIQKPRTVSIDTVTTVNIAVLRTAGQKSVAMLPGAHGTEAPVLLVHVCVSQ